jgi:hypothetical protein
MRTAALTALSIAVSVAVVAAAGGAGVKRSPRLEQLAPRAADVRLARKALIRAADLTAGWKGGVAKGGNDEAPDCAWQDFSAFTITGEAESDFGRSGARLISQAQVFARRADAVGDFRVDTRQGTAECEGRVFAKALGDAVKLVSARPLAAPNVGDRAAAYRFVLRSGSTLIYFHVIEFVRGRTLAGIAAFSVGASIEGLESLARLMDVRLQSNVA